MDKWKEIWNKDDRISKIILESLIKADGFDSGAGSFSVDDWMKYTNEFYHVLKIKNTDSIYDIGCGSGAFVYPLYLKKHTVGGLDYSKILIDLANTIMQDSDFINNESINVKDDRYDIVLSHSVFHYFKDLDYAKKTIKKMINKANKKIAILDVNDETKENEYHRIRMENMNKQDYKKKYQGLEHMFYNKEWFENIAKEFNLKINIFDQTFKKYSNSKLRFNVIMEKL
jgi:ubiquinone/menaquinone biosynthesis C-methylase UbiE